jgi:hypothetical protein
VVVTLSKLTVKSFIHELDLDGYCAGQVRFCNKYDMKTKESRGLETPQIQMNMGIIVKIA